MNTWLYKGKPIVTVTDKMLEGVTGFVYEIHNLVDGKRYIGKKQIFFKKTKLKNGKRKRFLVESDWPDYFGSNKELLEDVKKYGADKFERVILKWCKSKGELSYMEAQEQFKRNVLLDETYYNNYIRCRIHSGHVRHAQKSTG